MRVIILTILGIVFSGILFAQPYEFLNYSETNDSVMQKQKGLNRYSLLSKNEYKKLSKPTIDYKQRLNNNSDKKNFLKNKKIDFSLQVGTQVGTNFNKTTFMHYFVAPTVEYKLSKKTSVLAGVGVGYYFLNNFPFLTQKFEIISDNGRVTLLSAFAVVKHKLTPKTTLMATAIYSQNKVNLSGGEELNLNIKDISVGINYNVTRNFSIGAQIGYGNKPFNMGMIPSNGINPAMGFGY